MPKICTLFKLSGEFKNFYISNAGEQIMIKGVNVGNYQMFFVYAALYN
jgi:hypothetical protein